MNLCVSRQEIHKSTTMKNTIAFLSLISILISGSGQEIPAEEKDSETHRPGADTNDVVRVIAGDERLIIESDTGKVRIITGNSEIIIMDSSDKRLPKIETRKRESEESEEPEDYDNDREERLHRRKHFRGHWAGLEIGFNDYLTSGYSTFIPEEIDYMSLHTGKSVNFNINFSQLSIGLTRHTGFVTGLGLTWNNYVFDGNNNIQKGANGVIEILNPPDILKKSKFTTLYLHVPILLEFQIPTDHQRLNLSIGTIGAVKLHSHSKMIFENNDKVKSNDDFSLNMLRAGATARIGYENFSIYGTYYFTPLFKTGKAPDGIDLFPCEIGLAFNIN